MQIDVAFVAVVSVVVSGLVQAIKQIPAVTARTWLVPIVAVLLGVGIGLGAWATPGMGPATLFEAVLAGIAAGLAAVGLYEAVGKRVGGA